ncbi:hypothetical protein Tco_0209134 [Tanacetum coccineum]
MFNSSNLLVVSAANERVLFALSQDVLNLLRAMRLPVIPTNARSLLVKTISNGNSSGLTNDTHNIKNIDDSDILGVLTLLVSSCFLIFDLET